MSPVQENTDSPVVPASAPEVPEAEKVKTIEIMEPNKPEEMEIENENTPPKLYFAKLTEHASAPTKGSKFAAGYDLKSAYDAVVPKRGSCLVKTDIQIQLPTGTYGRIAPRSGLALKNKIDVGAGVVDEDYRGNIGVILFNHADEDFIVTKGDRIAQLICEKICYPEAVEVKTLDESERGAAGFGSTGGVKKIKLDGAGTGKEN
jgi:dUTP pyrophosphatase